MEKEKSSSIIVVIEGVSEHLPLRGSSGSSRSFSLCRRVLRPRGLECPKKERERERR